MQQRVVASRLLFLLACGGGAAAISFYPLQNQEELNGTTTLEEQATAGRDAPFDKNRLFNNRYKPIVVADSAHGADGGNFGLWRPPHGPYLRPRPPNFPLGVHRPPLLDHAPENFYQLEFQGAYPPGSFQAPGTYPPGGSYPLGGAYPPGDYVSPYGNDQCNIIAPLIALKKALFKVVKLAAIKLPIIALKVITKVTTFLVFIGPIMLPLLLLFPVPVYGFVNGFNNVNTGFGNSFGNNNNPNNVNTGNNNNNLNRNPNTQINNNNNLGRKTERSLPSLARGPCFPRIACEMGFWGYQPQIAWILDHVHETMPPTFPKVFFAWKRAYYQGGNGANCNTTYFCPKMDKLIKVAKDFQLMPRADDEGN